MTIQFDTAEEMNEYLEVMTLGFDTDYTSLESEVNDAFASITAQATISDIPLFRYANLND